MFEKSKLKKEIKRLEGEVESGNAQAMYDLAMIYLNNDLIERDEAKANELLNNAAARGHLQSKTYLITNKIAKTAAIGSNAVDKIIKIFNK